MGTIFLTEGLGKNGKKGRSQIDVVVITVRTQVEGGVKNLGENAHLSFNWSGLKINRDSAASG